MSDKPAPIPSEPSTHLLTRCTLLYFGGPRCEAEADAETLDWDRPLCKQHLEGLRHIYDMQNGKVEIPGPT